MPACRALFLFLSVISIPLTVTAFELRTGDQASVGAGERIIENLYLAGGNVTHLGAVTGDVLAGGGTILIQGSVDGDVLVVGGTVTILGKVTDDVRVVGGNITINSDVLGDVVAVGGQVTVAGAVEGDLVALGGTVRVEAPVEGNVRASGSSLFLNASVNGSVRIDAAEKVTLGPKAIISGDFVYSASGEAIVEEGATVVGEMHYTPRPNFRKAAAEGLIAFLSLWFTLKFLMLLASALVVGLMFKKYAVELSKRSLQEPLSEFVTGLVTLIVLPVVSLVFVASLLVLPLGLIGFLAFVGMVMFSHLFAPIVLGSLLRTWMLTEPIDVSWKTILLGSAVFYFIGFIPFVGWLARWFFMLLALGAALRFKWGIVREWR